MLHLLKISALVNQVINMGIDENYANIFALHMISQIPNNDDKD